MKKKEISYRQYLMLSSFIFASLIGIGKNKAYGAINSQKELNILTSNSININLHSKDIGIPAKTFSSVVVDSNNNKWFLTEIGIICLTGEKWNLHKSNSKVAFKDMRSLAYEVNPKDAELWIASQAGAIGVGLPIEDGSEVITYNVENSKILSNNVTSLAIGKGFMRWFGTDNGVSLLINNKWYTPSYEEFYPGIMFKEYPITSMATNRIGDSLYVGTKGAGVARVYRNDVDGISGASVYAQWGPIILPSDSIYSVFIASDGTKWFGTDLGVARHTGNNTLENWTVFTTEDGLIDNFVQAITADNKGNIWLGTKGGISVFNGSVWSSFTIKEGLNSNNILCLAVDKDDVLWIGTDDGVNSYKEGEFVSYR